MNITVTRDDLLFGLNTVGKSSPSTNTLSILSGVLIDVSQEGNLRLLATDLQLWIECTIKAKTNTHGSFVAPTRLLSDLIRKLPPGEVELDFSSPEAGVNIKTGKSEFNIRTLPVEEFPALPVLDQIQTVKIFNTMLRSMIKSTVFAASSDDARPYLTGVYTTFEDGLFKMVATDSWRLALRQENLPETVHNEKFNGAIVPSRALNEVARTLPDGEEEETDICISSNQICFTSANLRIMSRLLEGQFPPYKSIMPRSYRARLFVDRQQLLGATERAALLAKEKISIIRLNNTPSALIITANSPDLGKGYEEIDIEQQGEEMKVALDAHYLVEVLKVMESERIVMDLQSNTSAITLREESDKDYLHLIMPIKVG